MNSKNIKIGQEFPHYLYNSENLRNKIIFLIEEQGYTNYSYLTQSEKDELIKIAINHLDGDIQFITSCKSNILLAECLQTTDEIDDALELTRQLKESIRDAFESDLDLLFDVLSLRKIA